MSKPDLDQIIRQAFMFMQNPGAFEQFLNSVPNLPKEQKENLGSLFKKLTSGELRPENLGQIDQLLKTHKAQLPPEAGSLDSIARLLEKKMKP
ncbi:MAG: hypothetical protein QHH02_04485 [Syntrophomonadaceae bacterium]|nr:hypothetical protein [Syntrophomonadaceae bacterium]